MSIWASVGTPVTAADLHHPDTDPYDNTGPDTLIADIAYCHGEQFRLALWSADGSMDVQAEAMLDRAELTQLRANIDRALRDTAPREAAPAAQRTQP